MSKHRRLILAAIALVALAVGGTAITAAASQSGGTEVEDEGGRDDDASDTAISGGALQKASEAALDYTGGGEVTATEIEDEESYYEVEVTLEDGSQTDVQLDRDFNVVGDETD